METTRKEEQSLSALLEQDREMVMTQLTQDRVQESAVTVLEKEADRLMVRAGALGVEQASTVQGMLQILKCALPLVSSVSEAETWEKAKDNILGVFGGFLEGAVVLYLADSILRYFVAV